MTTTTAMTTTTKKRKRRRTITNLRHVGHEESCVHGVVSITDDLSCACVF
jgi:hypothetical protein